MFVTIIFNCMQPSKTNIQYIHELNNYIENVIFVLVNLVKKKTFPGKKKGISLMAILVFFFYSWIYPWVLVRISAQIVTPAQLEVQSYEPIRVEHIDKYIK